MRGEKSMFDNVSPHTVKVFRCAHRAWGKYKFPARSENLLKTFLKCSCQVMASLLS